MGMARRGGEGQSGVGSAWLGPERSGKAVMARLGAEGTDGKGKAG